MGQPPDTITETSLSVIVIVAIGQRWGRTVEGRINNMRNEPALMALSVVTEGHVF